MFWRISLFLIAFGFFAHEADARTCICPKNFSPVCGKNGVSYSNACSAKCLGIQVAYPGRCRKRRRCPVHRVSPCPTGTTREWVMRNGCRYPGRCQKKKGTRCISYSVACPSGFSHKWKMKNGCRVPAGCHRNCPVFKLQACPLGQKYKWVMKKGCRYPAGCVPIRKSCACIALYAPVCGVNGKTYGNSCRARCAGVRVRHKGACKRPTR